MKIKLKIAGVPAGYYTEYNTLSSSASKHVEFVGQVSDEELVGLYEGAKAFLALSQDEDFGITPVESMLCGTPVIAYFGGGYKETIVEGKTGVFFKDYSSESLIEAIRLLNRLHIKTDDCRVQAKKFSKEVFIKKMQALVDKI